MEDYEMSPLGSDEPGGTSFDLYLGEGINQPLTSTDNESTPQTNYEYYHSDYFDDKKSSFPQSLSDIEEEASDNFLDSCRSIHDSDGSMFGFNGVIYPNRETDDGDNEKIDMSICREKYKRVRCSTCHQIVLRNDTFVLDKDKRIYEKDGNIKYICLNCSYAIDDIHRLSDWEERPILNKVKPCYRCKKFKSAYRFKTNYCAYCSNKMKWRNKK